MASMQQFSTTLVSGSDQHWRVPGSTSAQLILSASQEQRGYASIFNDSSASLYLYFGGSAVAGPGATSNYDVKVASGTVYVPPYPYTFQGEIWGVWDGGGGWAHVLQLGVPNC